MSTTDATSAFLGLLLMGDGQHNSDWGAKTNANLLIIEAAIRSAAPVAEVREFYGTALPSTDWLWANGQAVSRTDYPLLFGAVGTTYGAGNNTTTFNVPDRREVVAMGQSTMGGTAARGLLATQRVLGAQFGEELHTLSVAELPVHSHATSDPGHAHGVYDPAHLHGYGDPGHSHVDTTTQVNNTNLINNGSTFRANSGNVAEATSAAGIGISISYSYTGIGIYSAGTGISIQNTGSGTPHNNMQPTLACNFIIRAR